MIIDQYNIDRIKRTQEVYDFAFKKIQELVPDAPDFLQRSMTMELLRSAAGAK